MSRPDNDVIISPGDIEGYSCVFEACARLVESSANKPLASALLLNAAIAISLAVHGRQGCEEALRGAIDNLPAADAKVRGQMN